MNVAVYVRNLDDHIISRQLSNIICFMHEKGFVEGYSNKHYYEDERNCRTEFNKLMDAIDEDEELEFLIVYSKHYLSIYDDKQKEYEMFFNDRGITVVSVADYYEYCEKKNISNEK